MTNVLTKIFGCIVALGFLTQLTFAQTTKATSAREQPIPPIQTQQSKVLATVNKKPITLSMVEFEFARTVGEKLNLSEKQTARAKESVLQRLINQRITLDYLDQHNSGAGKNQVIQKFDELEAQLAATGKKLHDHLAEVKLSKSDLEFQFQWQIAWSSYLKQKLTDEFLEDHFKRNRRDFDGTELRVAHLFVKPKTLPERAKLLQKVNEIYSQVQSGELTWDLAVKQHSQAPSKDSAGEMGWIKRDRPMPKSFSDTAFTLKLGEVSEPVETSFGIHLIKCVEIKAGKMGWRDNIEAVKKDAVNFLFNSILMLHRASTKIEVLSN